MVTNLSFTCCGIYCRNEEDGHASHNHRSVLVCLSNVAVTRRGPVAVFQFH